MQLNHLQPKTALRSGKRVARGGKRGKTAGRGTKGQKARAGHRIRPEIRDLIKKLPKLRGYGKNRARTVDGSRVHAAGVSLSAIDKRFESGDTVTPGTIVAKGLLRRIGGKLPPVKILGMGSTSKKFIISGCTLSESAKKEIEAAGGTVA